MFNHSSMQSNSSNCFRRNPLSSKALLCGTITFLLGVGVWGATQALPANKDDIGNFTAVLTLAFIGAVLITYGFFTAYCAGHSIYTSECAPQSDNIPNESQSANRFGRSYGGV